MGRARQLAGNENQDRILLDASAASTDEGEHLLLDASAATTDVGFFINTEIGTTADFPETQEDIILGKVTTHAVGKKREVFHSSGTFTVPNGVNKLYVSICGGGGDGQNQGSNQSGGGGAGGLFVPVFVYPGAVISVTLGAGGSGTFGGGATPTRLNTIDYVTIATTSNATNFGDLTTLRTYHAGFSNSTRAISGGGNDGSSNINTIDYVTIATTGNASDFGDASVGERRGLAGSSDCHGGIS